MATLGDVQATVSELKDTLVAVDAKLKEVHTAVQALRDQLASAQGPVTQEQLDALAASLEDVKTETAAVVQDASDI